MKDRWSGIALQILEKWGSGRDSWTRFCKITSTRRFCRTAAEISRSATTIRQWSQETFARSRWTTGDLVRRKRITVLIIQPLASLSNWTGYTDGYRSITTTRKIYQATCQPASFNTSRESTVHGWIPYGCPAKARILTIMKISASWITIREVADSPATIIRTKTSQATWARWSPYTSFDLQGTGLLTSSVERGHETSSTVRRSKRRKVRCTSS